MGSGHSAESGYSTESPSGCRLGVMSASWLPSISMQSSIMHMHDRVYTIRAVVCAPYNNRRWTKVPVYRRAYTDIVITMRSHGNQQKFVDRPCSCS